jgi:hypothetical protein
MIYHVCVFFFKAMKREDKLRDDLGREREEKLVLQRKHEEVLNELAHYLSEQKEQLIR